MTTELVVSLTAFDPIKVGIAELKRRYAGVAFDVSTPKKLAEVRKDRTDVRKIKANIEKVRVAEKDFYLRAGQQIDAFAKTIVDEIDPIFKTLDDQIKAEETRKAEAAKANEVRLARIQGLIDVIRQAPAENFVSSIEELAQAIDDTKAIEISASVYAELQDAAEAVRRNVLAKLESMHSSAVARKAESEALEAQRIENARVAAEQAATAAALATQRAELEAERAALNPIAEEAKPIANSAPERDWREPVTSRAPLQATIRRAAPGVPITAVPAEFLDDVPMVRTRRGATGANHMSPRVVFEALTEQAKSRTSLDNVRDVLDAITYLKDHAE